MSLSIYRRFVLFGLLGAMLSGWCRSQEGSAPVEASRSSLGEVWSARHVEHLWNRAGFGIRPEDVDPWVAAGPEALVDELLRERPDPGVFEWEDRWIDREALRDVSKDEFRIAFEQSRAAEQAQIEDLTGWWMSRMLADSDPLAERMTLFWHGHFTSSIITVRRSSMMIRQHETLRRHALGSFAEFLGAMLEDAALLVYLDNDENKRGQPNENLAREVMELFALGDGNYTEVDIAEAARALTGYGVVKHRFRFRQHLHDEGQKTILGREGTHDAMDLVSILLEQPACAEWVAERIIAYLEGRQPSHQRIAAYGKRLREADYELRPMLRALFLDPAFYGPDVMGAKILSPVDYVVGVCKRLRLEPHPRFLSLASNLLGQRLFAPPNVKGWEGRMTWLSTSALMQRGNVAAALLAAVELDEVLADAEAMAVVEDLPGLLDLEGQGVAPAMEEAEELGQAGVRASSIGQLLSLKQRNGEGALDLWALLKDPNAADAELIQGLCEGLLAIEPPTETLAMLTEIWSREREHAGLAEGDLAVDRGAAEILLRRVARLILSLPEAQLG